MSTVTKRQIANAAAVAGSVEYVILKLRYVNQECRRRGSSPFMGVREFRRALADAPDWRAHKNLLNRVEAFYADIVDGNV